MPSAARRPRASNQACLLALEGRQEANEQVEAPATTAQEFSVLQGGREEFQRL
jgi:hypothetical protein